MAITDLPFPMNSVARSRRERDCQYGSDLRPNGPATGE
jgi:hypothetical protein